MQRVFRIKPRKVKLVAGEQISQPRFGRCTGSALFGHFGRCTGSVLRNGQGRRTKEFSDEFLFASPSKQGKFLRSFVWASVFEASFVSCPNESVLRCCGVRFCAEFRLGKCFGYLAFEREAPQIGEADSGLRGLAIEWLVSYVEKRREVGGALGGLGGWTEVLRTHRTHTHFGAFCQGMLGLQLFAN